MRSRIDAFAAQFQANNAEYVAVVTGCSDEEWARICPNDGRTVAVVAFHMATVVGGLAGLVGSVMAGRPTKAPGSAEAVDRMNDDLARNHAGVRRGEVVDALSAGGAALLSQLRFLGDEDLDRSVGMLAGHEMTIGQVLQVAVIAHQRQHLDAIRGALGR